MKCQILVDNPASWIIPYAVRLRDHLHQRGWDCVLLHQASQVESGDVLCLLSCEGIFRKLNLNRHNLVVHESALPLGKGWSPLTWQILEGKSVIPITLFEATDKVDAGAIYGQDQLRFEGHELLKEIKDAQGKATIRLLLDFFDSYPNVTAEPQSGPSSYYPRRTGRDSELDVDKSIREQFNLLRVCDNVRYPAFFKLGEQEYEIRITKRPQP